LLLVGGAVDAALVAVVGVFAQPVFVALVIGVGRDVWPRQAKRRYLRNRRRRRRGRLDRVGLKSMHLVVRAVVKMVMAVAAIDAQANAISRAAIDLRAAVDLISTFSRTGAS
jgi:hypothetical protein